MRRKKKVCKGIEMKMNIVFVTDLQQTDSLCLCMPYSMERNVPEASSPCSYSSYDSRKSLYNGNIDKSHEINI